MCSRRHSDPQILLRLPPQGISSVLSDDAGADDAEPEWPFGRLETLDRDEIREIAYEIFFTACRSSPGFGGTRANYPSDATEGAATGKGGGGGGGGGTGLTVVNSRIKRALGLRTRRAAPMRPMSHMGSPVMSVACGGVGVVAGGFVSSPSFSSSSSSSPLVGKAKQRPMTSAEIMRQQMGVTDQSDNRLRKTLMRLSQVGKKAESIILPLELLRQLKPSEFKNMDEYHNWQRRQLKVLEAGLLLHPSVPLDRLNAAGLRFSEVMHASEVRPIDTSKNSELMRSLCNSVMTLALRNQNGVPAEVCHWTDGYPLNIHLYLALLRAIFDLRDETVVLDEVDELLELIKKTWTTLAINRMVHNVCFTWVLFEQYITTGQLEPDLLTATLGMLTEVAADAKRPEREPGYLRVLSATLSSMQGWAEKRLMDYHDWFGKNAVGNMENVLFLALSVSKILTEDVSSSGSMGMLIERENMSCGNFSYQIRVDHYIRSSLKNAFTKVFENGNGNADSMVVEVDEDPTETLMSMAKETEEMVEIEKNVYSPILKGWHPAPTAIAVVTLHNRYGSVLKQYLSRVSGVTNELIRLLQAAAKLEKELVRLAMEELAESEDAGKSIINEMIPYDVDSIIINLMKKWIDDTLKMGKECLSRAKETENWNPKSKSEPYAESAADLMKLAKVTVDEIFEIQVGAKEDLVMDLVEGLDAIFQEYISFVASCGSKKSYTPTLPPLTRCNQDSMVLTLWKKAATPCKAGMDQGLMPKVHHYGGSSRGGSGGGGELSAHSRSTTSRGTQRLYVRLNTLHYFLTMLHSIDKSLAPFSRQSSPSPGRKRTPGGSSRRSRSITPIHFDQTGSSIHSAILHVAEVAAYRLIFHDSAQYLHESLYVGSVSVARIQPALQALNYNLAYLVSLITERAQSLAVREIMKASFEAFLLVMLAGGNRRAFYRNDYEMILEDFASLKRIFSSSGQGLVAEEVVEREAAPVEGVLALMNIQTEKLVEEFSIAACEASGLGRSLERVPMPPTTGKWHRSDPNTMLRVLCHRNDDTANRFLKRTFDLPRRK